MNIFYKRFWLFFCTVVFGSAAMAQQDWPKSITGNNGELIKLYQPQVESYSGSTLKSRSAISVIPQGKTEPIFGACWWQANITDNGSTVTIQSLNVTNIKFPDGVDDVATADIKSKLESEIPQMNISITKDEVENSISNNRQQEKLSSTFNNTPPKVIYTTKPSMLVLIDGEPKLQNNPAYGVDLVVNSPFTIVKNNDGLFYLYGGKQWYSATSATGPYSYINDVPDNLKKIEATAKNNQPANNNNNNSDENAGGSNVIPQIIVSTEPAELIQSDGEPNFVPVENTSLLYIKNSSNDIFMDVNSQQYYVLLSGRWYHSSSLKSHWQYIAADKLPADFAKIPGGSPKDNVLASVAGTEEANEAVMDAAVPQTAKVDRRTATANVNYDGNPQFENISGTRLQYAVNASTTVLKMDDTYYAVDNGVWFQSDQPNGPWAVSTIRPEDVDKIPPSYPVYNSKYVYVYDATPNYVYTGYTPGYLNAYVYGPTIVYGTGYYYHPWAHHYYYPRPSTWGFSMNYTPWYGWGFGLSFGSGWFNMGYGSGWGGGYYHGGWWGPPVYHPAYCGGYNHNYGYYGYNRGYAYHNSVRMNVNYTNNIYYNRSSVVTNNNRSFVNNNRYTNNNRSSAFNNGRGANGNRFNDGNRANDGNRVGNNNNSRGTSYNNTNGNNRANNPAYRNPGNNNASSSNTISGGRTYIPGQNNNAPRNYNSNRPTAVTNNASGTGRRPSSSYQGQNNNTPGNSNNRALSQQLTRQHEYNNLNLQRTIDNNNNSRSFSRPQNVERPQPQRSSTPTAGFERGGGSRPNYGGSGGSRPSYGGSGNSGGQGRSGGGGNSGGGGGSHGGGRRG